MLMRNGKRDAALQEHSENQYTSDAHLRTTRTFGWLRFPRAL